MSPVNSFRGLSGRHYVVAPETTLLFLTANVHAGHDIDAHLRAVLDLPIKWDRVVELSNAHGTTELVRYRLRNGGHWNSVPEPVRSALDSWHHAMRIKHLM